MDVMDVMDVMDEMGEAGVNRGFATWGGVCGSMAGIWFCLRWTEEVR
jgi:hypothetical protein